VATVGYWPKEIFTYMTDSANEIGLFGAVGLHMVIHVLPWVAVNGQAKVKGETKLKS
jgi:hypothetical protein